ncbi:MAG: HEAT repeat domain-containing protein [Myxococcales bacterium]|nr:HEAT repeat domain-containing protein [Myxococcales bacterium]
MSPHDVVAALEGKDVAAVRSAVTAEHPGARAYAVQVLVALQVEGTAELLTSALSDPSWPVRAAACRAAGRLPTAAPTLDEALCGVLDDEVSAVRRAAVVALGLRGATSAGPALVRALEASIDVDLSAAIVDALGRLRHGTEALVARLDGALRSAVLVALARVGDPSAVPALVQRARQPLGGVDEWYLVAALRDIGARPPVYEALLRHPRPETRVIMVRVADEWQHTHDDALDHVLAAMHDPEPLVRRRAAFALPGADHEDADPRVRAALMAGLEDPDEDVRHYCQRALDGEPT